LYLEKSGNPARKQNFSKRDFPFFPAAAQRTFVRGSAGGKKLVLIIFGNNAN
jgi:hypothetical protein